jgi:hypothetical protein
MNRAIMMVDINFVKKIASIRKPINLVDCKIEKVRLARLEGRNHLRIIISQQTKGAWTM